MGINNLFKNVVRQSHLFALNRADILIRLAWGTLATLTFTYVLFQKKLLPLPVSKFVSKIFFLPTFPITAILRLGNYWTKVDDTLFLGCAPMGFLGHPKELHKIGVRGVVNMCYEYSGPTSYYEKLGITQLHLPTCDHFEPSVANIKTAIEFIEHHKKRGEKVYVHCKAGHGRAASIALCWLIHENKEKTPKVFVIQNLLQYILYITPNLSSL